MEINVKFLVINSLLLISSLGYAELDLSIMTFNAGYLETRILFQRVYVPDYDLRLKHFEQEILKEIRNNSAPSIITLQELWNNDAINEAHRVFTALGYTPISSKITNAKINYEEHGLEVFVKNDEFEVKNADFKSIHRHGGESVIGYHRGLLFANLSHKPSGKSVFVGTLHLTPTIGMTSTRATQIQDINNFVNSRNEDLILLGGDLNLSPTFSFSIKERGKDGSEEEWQENADLYPSLIIDGGLVDSYLEVNDDPGFTQDRLNNDIANFSPSTTEEPEQRIDYVFYKNQNNLECSTVSSVLTFTQPVTDDYNNVIYSKEDAGSKLYLSDHFGVRSNLKCND